MKKVLFITEYLNPPYDEGIKKTVYNLLLNLDSQYDLFVICRFGFKKNNVKIIDTNPLFFSRQIKSHIKQFKPDVLIYFPFQSSTFASYVRLKVLTFFAKNAKIIFLALQPKPLKMWQRLIVKFIKPKLGLTPSPTLHKFWNNLNVSNQLLPLLTDLKVFTPLTDITSKQSLKLKYNLPLDSYIISHMGHLNEGRNLKSLIPLQKNDIQVVIASSSSTPKDAIGHESIKQELLDSGIIILEGYIENIEEIYQLSDVYIFPVQKENSSIGMPLSILEARACGIPVVTTDYGSVKTYLEDDFGGIIYTNPENFLNKVISYKTSEKKNFSKTRVSELNDIFYNIVNKHIE